MTYSYDRAGRLAKITCDSGKTMTYIYDVNGNLVKREVIGRYHG